MKTEKLYIEKSGVTIEYSSYKAEGTQLEEIHAILHVGHKEADFRQQYQTLTEAQQEFLNAIGGAKVMMRRYFVSDATNQQPLMTDLTPSTSVIQQPPLDGSKIALWMYLHKGETQYEQEWFMNQVVAEGDSYHQTKTLLERYEENLKAKGMTIADNCIRTWFFVRDVDTQYHGLVVARRENFTDEGLTSQTHYLASTGIHGCPADPKAIIQLGTYAIKDIKPEQQQYLYAPTHLNPTYEYGVTFERGVKVKFGDRAHLYISGTASINNKGEVVHVGDITKQTLRMMENVETLLAEGGAQFSDVMQIIVYLRDLADYPLVDRMFKQKFPATPYVITLAPVCRPTWLIEMECIAVINNQNDQFKNY